MRINVKKGGLRKIELTKREHGVLEEAKCLLVELAKQEEHGLSDFADEAADNIGDVQNALAGAVVLTTETVG